MAVVARQFSPEFRLVAACCAWPTSEQRTARIRQAAAAGLDWNGVLALVRRHRVAGLVGEGVVGARLDVPAEARRKLADYAAQTARNALMLASETLRVHRYLAEQGLQTVFLKGATLDRLAYGRIGLKHAWDIDMLVAPADVSRAAELLSSLGYARVFPPPTLSGKRFEAWTAFVHEAIFQNTARVSLELHWRLTDNAELVPGPFHGRAGQTVEIVPGQTVETLSDDELFAFLCLHGAHHAWARLKWLADLAAWLATKSPDAIEALYRSACTVRAGRAAEQALLLSEALLGFALPAALARELGNDRTSRWLFGTALKAIAVPESALAGNFRVEASQFVIASTMAERWKQLQRRMVGWVDFNMIALPRPLFVLYPLIRLPSWLWRRVVRLG